MAVPAIDTVTYTADLLKLMGLGGLVAAVGFWLMLLVGPGGESVKIVLGSLQIPAPSAGVALFFGGMTAFSASVVAPGDTARLLAQISPASLVPGSSDTAGFVRASGARGGVDVDEWGDRVDARPLSAGALAGGTHASDDVDWFHLATSGLRDKQIAVNISEQASRCNVRIFDAQRNTVGAQPLAQGPNRMIVQVGDAGDLLLRLACARNARAGSYTITFGPLKD